MPEVRFALEFLERRVLGGRRPTIDCDSFLRTNVQRDHSRWTFHFSSDRVAQFGFASEQKVVGNSSQPLARPTDKGFFRLGSFRQIASRVPPFPR